MSPGARLGDGHNECRCCTLTREGRVRKLAALGAMLNQVPPTQLRSCSVDVERTHLARPILTVSMDS